MNHSKAPITYADAIQILEGAAKPAAALLAKQHESLAPGTAVGRIAKNDVYCPISTPPFDTSAMDGYAVNSNAIGGASDSRPMVLAVQGTMAAGDAPIQICAIDQRDESIGIQPCVEIMTGAQFPLNDGDYAFDAVIPVEHTVSVLGPGKSSRYIQINRAAMRHQHRRFAGEDFVTSATLVTAGSKIEPQHVMAMASMGIRKVAVQRRIRVGVWSTGAELAAGSEFDKIKDANGPFLLSALQGLGVDASFLGVLPDDEGKVAAAIKEELQTNEFDVLITSGAVSAGRFDHIRGAIRSIGAHIEFHGVAMRPGHPVLFATVPRLDLSCASDCDRVNHAASRMAFFGLPGNPIAAAACLRMIVTPYIRRWKGITLSRGFQHES